jgi:hypothetical protein
MHIAARSFFCMLDSAEVVPVSKVRKTRQGLGCGATHPLTSRASLRDANATWKRGCYLHLSCISRTPLIVSQREDSSRSRMFRVPRDWRVRDESVIRFQASEDLLRYAHPAP